MEDRTELVSQIFGMEKEDREREREREKRWMIGQSRLSIPSWSGHDSYGSR